MRQVFRVAALLSIVAWFGAAPAGAQTLLRLSETATLLGRPDEIVAELRVEAQESTAQAAQSKINGLATVAVTDARRVPGITVSTGGYRVYRVTQPREAWQASQSIRLRGTDGAMMLGLIGSLQAKGLAVSQLRWQLSDEQARKLRQDATKQAIAALKGRAEEAAGLLGLRFVQFREVRLDSVQPQPFMQPRLAMTSSAAMAPPVAEAEDVPVSASVEADVELRAP